MNIHKNARLTFARRLELVGMMIDRGFSLAAAAHAAGVTEPTARKWLGRYLAEGETSLHDRSSKPKNSPRTIKPEKAVAIVELRRRRLTQARIAASLGVSESTVGRVLRRAGLSRLRDLEPSEPIVRYEHEHPGDMVHIDTKKLGRIERMGKRIPGSSRSPIGAGWEFLFVAVDDHSRIAFTDLYPDERKGSAVQFLRNTVAYFQSLGVRVQRVLTDNGSAFRSKQFAAASRTQAPLHPRLPPADERQGRTFHPISTSGMGIWHRVQPFDRTRGHARALAAPLQLPSPSSRNQRHDTDQSLTPVPQ